MEDNSTAADSIDYSISFADNTSPSQLQEVTLDQDGTFSNTMGLRSPGGPMRGRTVKEFEEQLTNLKKENFNLKLRIYFLEEKMGTNFTLDKDNIVKKNIELQVEIANLQKEVKEKHELLCQAVKAMELEEDEHRKYSQNKEDQVSILRQEMEDLRVQLQDIKFHSTIDSVRSGNSSKNNENPNSKCTFSNEYPTDLEYKIRFVGDEVSNLAHQTHQTASVIFSQAQNINSHYENLQRECQIKDETINSLNNELSSANERLVDFAQQIKEYEEKLAKAHLKNEDLIKKMQEEQKTMDKLYGQLANVNQKYSVVKYEFEQEKKEFEREKKSLDRGKMMLDMKNGVLENENKKNKEIIKDLHDRLDQAIVEAKKNQNIAVSKSRNDIPNNSHTDGHFISVPSPAAPDGTPKKDPLHVPISEKGRSSRSLPSSPDSKALSAFERLLKQFTDSDKVLNDFDVVKSEFNGYKQKIVKLKSEQLKACEIIKNMIDFRNKANEEISQLKKVKEELEKELESVVSKPQKEREAVPLHTRVSELNITAVGTPDYEKPMAETQLDDMEIVEHYKALTVELEAKIEVLVATLKEKDSQMQDVRAQYDDILNTLEEKENRIVDLEFELLSSNQSSGKIDRSLLEKGDMGSEKHSSFYKQELDEKNQEIERLNVELKKCTCYLQEIVNKELWDKNREIEKMHKKQESIPEVVKLKKELSGKDLQLKVLKEKISELGLDIKLPNEDSIDIKDLSSPKRNIQNIKLLQDQLKAAKEEKKYFEERAIELEHLENDMPIVKLQYENLGIEMERCERLRAEANDVCTILSNRLEELAIFLDSLLKQKSVLGFLGSAKNKRLREIINNSLDLSRSFTMSLMLNPEQSLTQLSNITALLNGSVFQDLSLVEDNILEEENAQLSIVPDNITLTYESHLYRRDRGTHPDTEQVIAALREQVFNLKSELKLRDNELNRLNSKESGVEKLTETEDEKEVSKLFTPKGTTSTTLKLQSEGHSESEAWSEPDRIVSRARIGLNHSVPSAFKPSKMPYNESTEDDDIYHSLTPSKRRQTIIELHQEVCRLEKELEEKSEEAIVNSRMYRQKLQEMDKEVEETREKLRRAEIDKNDAEKKMKSLQKIVDDLSIFKKQYEENLEGKDKEMQDKINQLEVEKEKILRASKEFEHQAINAHNQVIAAEEKLKTMEEEIEKLENNLRKEYEHEMIEKLKTAEEVFTKKVRGVEDKCEAEVKKTSEHLRKVQEEYCRDYVRKSDVERKLVEVEKLVNELEDLKVTVQSYEETINSYKEKEREIKGVVQEYQDKLSALRENLDHTTLQFSEAVLEKTKLNKEKVLLEQEVTKISVKEKELMVQLNDIQDRLTDVTEKYEQQVVSLQKQKTKLELKLSELESANAELHNRLVKAQTGKFGLNATLPSTGSSRLLYKRQCSDQNTYSSEDNAEELRNVCFNRPRQSNPLVVQQSPAEVERTEANSSPDLGIESDHGRFSSLETQGNNIPRPLLQTIELTESMNNLFDGQTNQLETINCGSEHCCHKSLEISQENNDLKRKLLRMKRALEETATQLNLANQRKKQVEKTICKQIHKTSQVLRKAKANLDSGSESDVLRM